MNAVAMTGNDTLSINNTILPDLADGDAIDLEFPNPVSVVKIGKNSNAIYAENAMGKMAKLKVRVIRASFTDKFLNGLLQLQLSNYAAFPLMIGNFTKIVGDGTGNVTNDIYVLSGGTFEIQVPGKNNVEGDTNASISLYSMAFALAPRAIT